MILHHETAGAILYSAASMLLLAAGVFLLDRAYATKRRLAAVTLGSAATAALLAMATAALLNRMTTADFCIYLTLGLWTVGSAAIALFASRRTRRLPPFAIAITLAIATAEVLTIPLFLLSGW